MTTVSSHRSASPLAIALVGTIALAVAMGIGRFAFTPLLPMMLHDGTLDLHFGSWLATANYAGYLIGAMLCMALPRRLPGTILIKGGLAATIALTLGMALPIPLLWPALRFLAGMASAMVFVFTSGWCLARFARLGMPARGAVIFTGPGIGIALSGLSASVMVAVQWTATSGWLVFGLISALLSALVWTGLREPDAPPPVATPAPADAPASADAAGSSLEMAIFTLAYGLAGFGYIITATFLPVIAREALPDSLWLDLFWPILGLGVVAGALLSTLVPARIDPRLVLTGCYLFQAVGVVLGLLLPSLTGFIAGSVLMGLPFTAITFFAMQEVRRLRPYHAARFMGLLTAFYGLGQIAGPPLAAFLLAHSQSRGTGFALSLGIASATLVTGAILYVVMSVAWPIARPGSTAKP